MADDVWAWCQKAQAFGYTVTVKLKFADFRQATRSRTLNVQVTSQALLLETSRLSVIGPSAATTPRSWQDGEPRVPKTGLGMPPKDLAAARLRLGSRLLYFIGL